MLINRITKHEYLPKMYGYLTDKINNLFSYIITSDLFRLLSVPFVSEEGFVYYGRYLEHFPIYTYRNKIIEEIAQKHVENGNIIIVINSYIVNNYAWHIGTVAKYFILVLPTLMLCAYIVNTYNENKDSYITKTINFFLTWIKFFFEKLENMLEGYISLKFFFFLMFLFFSNFFEYDDNINYVIFIEWNIPVCFGMVLILELIFMLKSFTFMYLNGSKTKKIILVTYFEDLINFFILNIRILLQLIRGIICGIYHDLLREYNIKTIIYLHEINFEWINSNEITNADIKIKILSKILFVICYLFIITFAVILMFLQALFLFLAIWLFCKCWFMSVSSSKYLFKNKINITKFFKKNVKFLNKSCYLFMGSKCNVSKVKLFHIYRNGRSCRSKISFFCKTSVRKLRARRRADFKKKKKLFSIFVRTKQWILRKDGSQRRFSNNSVIILKKNAQVWTNHIFGPTTIELKRKKILSVFKKIY